jgi:membrane protease subunit HflC
VLRALHRTRAGVFAALGLALVAASSVTLVGEGDQAVITRFGAPMTVVNRFVPDSAGRASGAGAVLKLPFVDRVIWLARGLQGYSLADQKVRTSDEQVLLLDTDVTYRIIDPVRLVSTLGSGGRVGDQIHAILPSLLEQELAQVPARTIALPGSGGANQRLLSLLDAKMRAYGVQAVDLRVGRVVLPENGRKLAFERMQDRYDRKAWDIANAGVLDARRTFAQADADAAATLQKSAAQDLAFYDYFSSLRNYEANFGDPARKGAATIVIPPDSDYLKHFNGK